MTFFANIQSKPISYLLGLLAYSFGEIDDRFYTNDSGEYCYDGLRKDLVSLLRMTSLCNLNNTFYLRTELEESIYSYLSDGVIIWPIRKYTLHIIDMEKIRYLFGWEIFESLKVIFSDINVSLLLKAGRWDILLYLAEAINAMSAPSDFSASIFSNPNKTIATIVSNFS